MAGAPPLTAGERWSRELLEELRSSGYRADAWTRFVARSVERAGETRAMRPALTQQSRRWTVLGGLGVLCASEAGARSRTVPLAWWAICAGMLRWHLGMVEGPRGERRERLSRADALTLARAALVPFVAAPRGRAAWTAAVVAAAATDALDGPLARRTGVTRLGAQLDSTADAAFVTGAAWGAARAGWLGRPAALAPIARKAGGVALATQGWFARGEPPALGERVTRWATAPTVLGLVLAGAGAKAAAERLLVVTSLAALAPTVAALRVLGAQDRRTSERAYRLSASL